VLVLVQPGAEPGLLGLLLVTAAREEQVNQIFNTDYSERKVKPQITQKGILVRFALTDRVALREAMNPLSV
jgi:hypothetical protein